MSKTVDILTTAIGWVMQGAPFGDVANKLKELDEVKVKVWREDDTVKLPVYAKQGDACMDVYVHSIEHKEDVEKFITDVDVMTVGDKTTVVNAHTLTGFDTVRHSSCVDPKNYNEELGKKYAMEEVVNSLWAHLDFVLQWAKYGLKSKK